MRDAMESRFWADHGSDFADNMVRLYNGAKAFLKETKIAFERLNEIEFSAPWREKQHRGGARG